MKLLLGSRRNDLSVAGIVNRLDSWIDQTLLTTSNVQFNDLHLTGNLIVDHNVTIRGQQTIVEASIVRLRDDIIEINADNPAPLNRGGISIQRGGSLPAAQLLWDETTQTMLSGTANALRPIATYAADNMANAGIVVWDAFHKQLVSTTSVTPSIEFTNPMAALSGIFLGTSGSKPSVHGNTNGDLL
jgi:hypothetical protein